METNWCYFTIDEDNMSVKMALKLPDGDEAAIISAAYINNFLRNNGITFGVSLNALDALAHQVKYGQEVEVARGRRVENGVDGHVSFLVPVEDTKKPVIQPDGSVDYLNSLKLAQIGENEVFARYIHATPGVPGTDVFSNVVPPVPGKETKPMKGKGFTFDPEKDEYRSNHFGHIVYDNGQITIDKLYIHSGDLDMDTGNIVFNGDVEVTGDVRSGLSITSEGSIFIHGHVGACMIKAKDNITINEGVQGRGRCHLIAGNDVTCKFVERCHITAGGNIYADSVLDSTLVSRNQVRVLSKTGTIIGGNIYGALGIETKEAGNESETTTRLQSGPLKEDMEKIREVYAKLQKVKKNFEDLETQHKKYNGIPKEKRTPKIEDLRMKIIRAKVVVYADLNKYSDEFSELSIKVQKAKELGYISISGVSHPGVIICIGDTTMNITEAFKGVRYTSRQGSIIAEGT